jgi:hypothetical protein
VSFLPLPALPAAELVAAADRWQYLACAVRRAALQARVMHLAPDEAQRFVEAAALLAARDVGYAEADVRALGADRDALLEGSEPGEGVAEAARV